jgi:outer membrane biosynthesis protein TonB
MSGILLSRLVEFALQTAILLGLLWGMIKIQKLDQKFEYNFLGLLGSAALATGLDQILEMTLGRFIGVYLASFISTPIVGAVLLLCLKKVTHAPYVDVLFTAAISYALLFGVNLFILGSLMGDLRPSARNPDEFEVVTQQQEIKKEQQTATKTNLPAPKANPPAPSAPANPVKPAEKTAPKTNSPAPSTPTNSIKPAKGAVPMTNLPAPGTSTNSLKPPETAAPKTNQPAQSTPTNSAPQTPAKPVEVIAKYFAVKGVTRNAAKSAVTIQAGTKIYTIFLGETALTQTPDGPIPVRFKDLGEDWVVLEINGEQAMLPIH